MMKKVLYFDLGGVVFNDFFSGGEVGLSRKLDIPSEQVVDAYIKTDKAEYCIGKISEQDRWKLFTDELGLDGSCVAICIDEYYKSYKPIEETVDLIKELSLTSKFRLGILSDQPKGVTEYLRKNYQDIFALFQPELTLISAELGQSKKDQELDIYRLAIKRSSTDIKDILFIDNSKTNIDNAKILDIGGYFFDICTYSSSKLVEALNDQIYEK